MKNKIYLILFLLIRSVFSFAKTEVVTPKLSLGFVANTGQWNAVGKADYIKYQYKGISQTVQLCSGGLNYIVQRNSVDINPSSEIIAQKISLRFLGSNQSPEIIELEKGDGQLIFHSPENFSETYIAQHYKQILYRNIYPNIDIQYVISSNEKGEGQFKYNFILHPGARVEQIQLAIEGADGTKVNHKGTLCLRTAFGDIQERIPSSYELNTDGSKGSEFKACYTKLRKNVFGFRIPKKLEGKTLLIDPLSWCTYFGGSVVDVGYAVVSDKGSNLYLSGITSSTSGFASTGAYQVTHGGGYDGFLAKFSTAGAMLWTTYFGGTGDERVTDIGIDNAGNIILSGYTVSTTGIANGVSMQSTIGGLRDGFVAKFTPAGANIWATYYGYSGDDYFYGMTIDKDNDVYLCGKSNSTSVLPTGGFQNVNAGIYDAFILKMTSQGAFVFSSYFGGTLNEEAMAICVDANKNFYITGESASTAGIATSGAYQTVMAGQMDIFVARFDSACKLKFATYYGGTQNDYGNDMTLDVEGKLVVTGHTSSSTKVATAGAFQTAYLGNPNDGYVLRIDTLGNPLWASYVGGDGQDYLYGLITDQFGNIYLTGTTGSTTNISTPGAPQVTFGGASQDASLLKFSKNGAKIWGTYIGGTGGDLGFSLTHDGANSVYLLGQTLSPNNIATTGAYHTSLSGGTDAFLYKYSESAPSPIDSNRISSNQGLCVGNAAQTLVGSFPIGGNGSYTYLWLSSNTGIAGSFSVATGLATNSNYSPGILNSNRYFRRVVYSATYFDTSNMVSILVSNGLNAGFTLNKGIQCLRSNLFIFTDTTNASGLTYEWDFGNGKTSVNNPDSVHYDAAVNNMYTVRLITSFNGACRDTNYKNVYVINDPLPNTLSGKDTVMRNTSEWYSVNPTPASSYQWIIDKGTGNSQTSSILIKWTQIGDAKLMMLETNGGGCRADTLVKNIYVLPATGIDENSLSDVELYPNPNDGILHIDAELKVLRVCDLSGRPAMEWNAVGMHDYDIRSLPVGVYIFQLTNNRDESVFRSLVKKD